MRLIFRKRTQKLGEEVEANITVRESMPFVTSHKAVSTTVDFCKSAFELWHETKDVFLRCDQRMFIELGSQWDR